MSKDVQYPNISRSRISIGHSSQTSDQKEWGCLVVCLAIPTHLDYDFSECKRQKTVSGNLGRGLAHEWRGSNLTSIVMHTR